MLPSKAMGGTLRLSYSALRSCSHCVITVASRVVAARLAWVLSRERSMPSTPRQASADITAITTSATSTSTSVKPPGLWPRLPRCKFIAATPRW